MLAGNVGTAGQGLRVGGSDASRGCVYSLGVNLLTAKAVGSKLVFGFGWFCEKGIPKTPRTK
jgi:hypothetical protein